MADVDITPTSLVLNTVSADILDTDGTAISDATNNVFSIKADGRGADRLLLKFLSDSSGDTVVIKAGDRPPALLAGVGDLSLTFAANDVRYIVVESARFMQDDGTINVTCGDDGTTCKAFELGISTPHPLNP
ncbi:hypothetical protein LCGC14_1959740 [marine sediment metagenome]|uniref:Uncharacterized protein n=1 Tax=marine sediment metagenome TaxID=412755 RepID=A0A0F9IC20_9ZZZZ